MEIKSTAIKEKDDVLARKFWKIVRVYKCQI